MTNYSKENYEVTLVEIDLNQDQFVRDSTQSPIKKSYPDDHGWDCWVQSEAVVLGAPDALLNVERGNHHGLVVDLRCVLIERRSGLSAEVAVACVELCSSDTVFTADAGELHAAGDSFDGVMSHWLDCSPGRRIRSKKSRKRTHKRWAAKVTNWQVK